MSAETRIVWEFLNSLGLWVECIGGEGHAHAAADADGPGKYRRKIVTTETENFQTVSPKRQEQP